MPTTSFREDLQRRIRRLEGLPSMPGALSEIWRAVRDPECSPTRLSGAISTDPGLTARLLRMSNSAYYGLNRPVSDVREAVVVLGFEVVKSMAIGASVVDAFRGSLPGLDALLFWKHSVHTAIASDLVARAVGGVRHEVVFCGGILHDVGKLALVSVVGNEYARVAESPLAATDWVAAELEVLGVDHPTAGLWLGSKWKFSEELLDIVAFHHSPGSAGENSRLATTVAVAESLLPVEGPACPEVDVVTAHPEWAQSLGLDETELQMLANKLPERLRAAGPMMQVA